ncbi:MAG TPA: phosphatase PAP2 family protein [Bryobacteraceae bacterium]|jgi:membrane-associated phospholipid phosphatase
MINLVTDYSRVLNTLAPGIDNHRVPAKAVPAPNKLLHAFMLAACASLLTLSIIGCWLTSASELRDLVVAPVLLAISIVPAAILHDYRQYARRDAVLTLPWIVVLVFLIPCLAVLSAQLHFPLRDSFFLKMDDALGFRVPAAMAWSSAHPLIGGLLNSSYSLLDWLVIGAVLFPIIFGKARAAEQFLLANTIAFLLALPIFTLLPAVGPWVGYHLTPDAAQRICEMSIRTLHGEFRVARQNTAVGVVCFPSFHVIWAILSAAALWSIKPLRMAAAGLAAIITISTVTTGWHYFADVLGAAVVAVMSILLAKPFLNIGTHVHKSSEFISR